MLVNVVVAVLMKHLEESNVRNQENDAQALAKAELSLVEEEEEAAAAAAVGGSAALEARNSLAAIERSILEVEDRIAEEVFDDEEQYLSEASSLSSTTRSHIKLYATQRPLQTIGAAVGDGGSFRMPPTRRRERADPLTAAGTQTQSLRSNRSIARDVGADDAPLDGLAGARLSASAFLNSAASINLPP